MLYSSTAHPKHSGETSNPVFPKGRFCNRAPPFSALFVLLFSLSRAVVYSGRRRAWREVLKSSEEVNPKGSEPHLPARPESSTGPVPHRRRTWRPVKRRRRRCVSTGRGESLRLLRPIRRRSGGARPRPPRRVERGCRSHLPPAAPHPPDPRRPPHPGSVPGLRRQPAQGAAPSLRGHPFCSCGVPR
jgi:hypothetical protein